MFDDDIINSEWDNESWKDFFRGKHYLDAVQGQAVVNDSFIKSTVIQVAEKPQDLSGTLNAIKKIVFEKKKSLNSILAIFKNRVKLASRESFPKLSVSLG